MSMRMLRVSSDCLPIQRSFDTCEKDPDRYVRKWFSPRTVTGVIRCANDPVLSFDVDPLFRTLVYGLTETLLYILVSING